MKDNIINIAKTVVESIPFEIFITIVICMICIKMADILFKRIQKSKSQIHLAFFCNVIQGVIILYTIYKIGSHSDTLKTFATALATNTSLIVVVAGFAAKETLTDIISGLSISISKPFEINDRITLSTRNLSGIIEDMTLRHTVIRTFNNSRVIIPNSVINKEILENTHYKDQTSGHHLEIRVDYNSNVDKAIEIMRNVIENHSSVIDARTQEQINAGEPKIKISVSELGLDGIILKATIWTENIDINFNTCSDLRLQIKEEFEKNMISIPYRMLNNSQIIDDSIKNSIISNNFHV